MPLDPRRANAGAPEGGGSPPGRAALGTAGRWFSPAAVALLVVGTLALYARVASYGFIRFDDNRYLTENFVVQQGLGWDGVAWAFTTLHVSNWHPLTWLSHMLDVQLFGMNAGAHHLVNAVLHSANAALVYLALARMTGARGRSAVVAALFAVHPLHVESVAWIAERKDVLSTLFGLLALWAYARHAERPSARRLVPVVLAFALSLLAKPMWVTLPFLLLLLDFWPLGRVPGAPREAGRAEGGVPPRSWRQLLVEKAPLLALSVASSAITVVAQSRGGALSQLGLAPRLGNAAVSYLRYLGKTFWPSSLSIFYPLPRELPGWAIALAVLALLAVTATSLRWAWRAPWIAVGWCWFVGTLVPVIGIVQVGGQAMADRYTYLPLVGVFIAIVWGVHGLARRWRGVDAAEPALAAVAVLALSALASGQLRHWSTNERLFRHALDVAPDNALAHGVLSDGLRLDGHVEDALLHARTAVLLDPGNVRHLTNLGLAARDAGLLADAKGALEDAVRLDPRSGAAWLALGGVYDDLDDLQGAGTAYEQATRLAPGDPNAWFRLGVLRTRTERIEEAMRCYREVVDLAPHHFAAWTNLAVLYQGAGLTHEAGQAFEAATRADPDDFVGWRNLGVYRMKTAQHAGAADALRQALRIRPGDADVLRRLGVVALTVGARADALGIAAQLDHLDPRAAAEIREHAARP